MKVVILLLFSLVLFAGGCSLLLDFEPNGRPCTPTGECLPGYACILDRCIPSRTINEGASCFQNANCREGLVCLDFVCLSQCTSPLSTEQCPPQSICNVGSNAYQNHVLGCTTPPMCSTALEDACSGETETCYPPNSGAGFCLLGCSADCSQGQICENSCGINATCQFIQGALLCLPAGTAQVDEPCSIHSDPCSLGSTCMPTNPNSAEGLCRVFCDVESPICPSTSDQAVPLCESITESLGICTTAK